jgi:hypothetical protein
VHGPTLFNLRAGAQILLGLPFAEEEATIEEIRQDFSAARGRLLLRDKGTPEIVRAYNYPATLALEINPQTGKPYAVGDDVRAFAPLVRGAEVLDYVKDPTWFEGYLQQGVFHEVQKLFTFLVRIDHAAFELAALGFVQSFIRRIKPTYTHPIFVVLTKIDELEISVTDLVTTRGRLLLDVSVCEHAAWAATMWDQPRPAGGGWKSRYDGAPLTSPAFPNPTHPIVWGFDKNILCPEDAITAEACVAFGGPTLPRFDSIFAWDTPVFAGPPLAFQRANVTAVLAGPAGTALPTATVMPAPGAFTEMVVEVDASSPAAAFEIVVTVAGVDVAVVSLLPTPGGFRLATALAVAFGAGDVVRVRVRPATPGVAVVDWATVTVLLGRGIGWAYDTPLAAGIYCARRTL